MVAENPAARGKRKQPRPVSLDSFQRERVRNRLRRFTCSEPWEDHCYKQILDGTVRLRGTGEQQEVEFRRAGVYPPGGLLTRMERCACCGRWHPPQYNRHAIERVTTVDPRGRVAEYQVWRPVCADDYYAALPLAEITELPSSLAGHKFADADALAAGLRVRRCRPRSRRAPPLHGNAPGRPPGGVD